MMPELAVDALEVAHDDVARRRVEARDRLVGQDDRRLLRERARDPDPLLLAARQVARADVGLLDDADPLQGLHARSRRRRAGTSRATSASRPCDAGGP